MKTHQVATVSLVASTKPSVAAKKQQPVRLSWARTALIVAIFAVGAVWYFPNLETIAVMLNLMVKDTTWHPLEYVTNAPSVREEQVSTVAGRSMKVKVHQPLVYDRVLMLYAPWANAGNTNAEVDRIASTFARLGFLVISYSREEGTEIDLPNAQTTADLVAVAHHFLDNSAHPAHSIGFFGISIGNGPMFAAASDPSLADRSAFVIAFSTFYDYREQYKYIMQGQVDYKDIHLQQEPDSQYMADLTKLAARHGYSLEEFLRSPYYEQSGNEISPIFSLDRISIPVYIMHSASDGVFPYTNALEVADSLKSHTPVRLLITDLVKHGGVRKLLPSTLKYYFTEGFAYFEFLKTFLHEQT